MGHTNSEIDTGGTAQDILSAGHGYLGIAFQNTSNEIQWVRVGGEADDGVGESVAAGATRVFDSLLGQQVSIYGATTGKTFTWRESLSADPLDLISQTVTEGETLLTPSSDAVHGELAERDTAISDLDTAKYELPAELPELPATPTEQDIADALVTLGLVTQAEE